MLIHLETEARDFSERKQMRTGILTSMLRVVKGRGITYQRWNVKINNVHSSVPISHTYSQSHFEVTAYF